MSLLVVGCASKKAEPSPEPAPKADEFEKLGEKIDMSGQRAAAAVTVAVDQADKPEVVKAEGKVALAYLPKPTEADVAFAKERASKQDQKAYNAQIEYAKKLQADVDKAWAKAEQEAKKSQADIQALKDRNNELVKQVDQVKKDQIAQTWTMAGIALIVIGGFVSAIFGLKLGIPLIITGFFTGAGPYIMSYAFFEWIVGGSLLLCAALAIWRLYDYVKDKNNEPA